MNWLKLPVWAGIFASVCVAAFVAAGSANAQLSINREGPMNRGPIGPGRDFPSGGPQMCPPGTTGIPPRCVQVHGEGGPKLCPPGTVGLPPKCKKVADGGSRKCRRGYEGTPPHCVKIGSKALKECKPGTKGTPPECVKIGSTAPKECPRGTKGKPPECVKIGRTPPDGRDSPGVIVGPILPGGSNGNAAAPDTPGVSPAPGQLPPLAPTNVEVPQFRPNELVVMVSAAQPDNVAATLAQSFNVNLQERTTLGLLPNVGIYRFRIPDNRSVEGLAQAISATPDVVASPNFYHQLQADDAAIRQQSAPATQTPRQELPPQYALPKMHVPDAQTIATGKGVIIAVIDSGVDAKHPAFSHSDLQLMDVVDDGKAVPDKHGTSVAGLIAGRGNVTGVAPDATILAVRAFAPEGSITRPVTDSMRLARAVDMAFTKGARIFNMSFAGPRDPLVIKVIDAAYAKGAVFIAAVGNNGPGAPPAFPAAYEKVIAITATDEADKLYAKANRGHYVTAAAPGVDILAPVTGDGFDYQTGTSFATAHVTGIVALLKQRNPQLTPDEVRQILTGTAHALTKKEATEENEDYGAGLADAFASVKQVQTK